MTENDRKRLLQLKEELTERMQHEETEDYRGVISYMLDENCKLEQEAVQDSFRLAVGCIGKKTYRHL